ncbi:odorant receptor Or1-like [Hylaeus anthracinus]|uniref:odorant receptor Or1-like n=1 Tax=Hylaeus anthracinus TaxID=313031 RepID=UPI0023B900C3|nr:odorant receptor Or1-like [Hylaeus anthracinus]
MRILRATFTILTLCGCLRPSSWTSPYKRILYNVYSSFLFLTTHALLFSQILDVVLNVKNQDEFSDNIYMTLAIFISCYKMCNFLYNRKKVAFLIDTLQKEPFVPMNAQEVVIRRRCERIATRNTIAYTTLVECCVLCMWITSFIRDFGLKQLTYRAWLPYDYTSSSLAFTVTFAHQIAGLTIGSFLNVAYDTLYSGMLLHTYYQLEVLEHRLKNVMEDEKYSVKQCAHHHHRILQFATIVHETFKTIACAQFLVSTSIVCFNLYRLTQTDLGARLAETVLYAFCMLTEIFYYCWYGNEVRLKSLEIPDMIIKSDWISLDVGSRKILLMIMKRATVSIEFTSIHVVSMNLESFMTLLKTSYTAYNVLQQGQTK